MATITIPTSLEGARLYRQRACKAVTLNLIPEAPYLL